METQYQLSPALLGGTQRALMTPVCSQINVSHFPRFGFGFGSRLKLRPFDLGIPILEALIRSDLAERVLCSLASSILQCSCSGATLNPPSQCGWSQCPTCQPLCLIGSMGNLHLQHIPLWSSYKSAFCRRVNDLRFRTSGPSHSVLYH
jgi:hypothetical protein